jgi:hypothetical protein
VPPKPQRELAESQARCAGTLKSAPRPAAPIFERKLAGQGLEPPPSVMAAGCGTQGTERPSELSAEDFEEIVDVFRILKRWRDEAGQGEK